MSWIFLHRLLILSFWGSKIIFISFRVISVESLIREENFLKLPILCPTCQFLFHIYVDGYDDDNDDDDDDDDGEPT